MNKTLLATLIGGSILLAGCDDKSIDKTSSSDVDSPIISFAPLSENAVLSTPNDLLIEDGSQDPTTAGRLSRILGGKPASADVFAATAQLDGWGLSTPFTIAIELPGAAIHQTKLDASSIEQDGVVYIFKCAEGTSVATQSCTTPSNTQLITPLKYGTDYTLTAVDDGIVVTPLKPFEANTGYFLGVTSMVQDSFGQSVIRSETFATYSQGTGSDTPKEQALNGLLAGTNSLLSAFTGLSAGDFMYSATWTTQDVDATAQAVMDNIVTDAGTITGLTDTTFTVRDVLAANFDTTFEDGSPEAFITGNTKVWAGALDLPYYLPYPGLPSVNAGMSLTCDFSALCGNWVNAQGQSTWKGSPAPVEPNDPARALYPPNVVNVQLLVPNATLMGFLATQEPAITEVKIVQYVHGISSVKESAYAISPALASAGFAIIAIDQPLHGSRSFDADGNGIYEITASNPSNGPQYVNGNSAAFVNLASLLTGRDNLRQAASDQLALRWAIENTDLSAANAVINETDVSLLGISLGSIVGTVAQGMSEIRDDEDGAFTFTASALSVGGSQVGPILGYSDSFGPVTKESLISTTSFSGGVGPKLGYGDIEIAPSVNVNEAIIIQAATGDSYGAAAQAALGMTAEQAQALLGATEAQAAAEFDTMIKLGYPGFLRAFINGAQAVVDGGDSSIWATKTTTTPTLVHQVIGDQTVPNDVLADGYPLAGTYGWLNALDLEQKSETSQGSGLRVYTNFTEGSHSSLLDPTASPAATTEMQTQIVKFLATQGSALIITDASVVE